MPVPRRPDGGDLPGRLPAPAWAARCRRATTGPNQALYYASAGVHDPCYPATRPMAIALAVDLNGNGKRDYGEPIIVNDHERFQDTGVDGCADPMEDGKGGCVTDASQSPYDAATNPDPNGDDYDFRANALGTENDWQYEKGEPFDDNGLDGVPDTHDFGEGNGTYDVEPAYQNLYRGGPPHQHPEPLADAREPGVPLRSSTASTTSSMAACATSSTSA